MFRILRRHRFIFDPKIFISKWVHRFTHFLALHLFFQCNYWRKLANNLLLLLLFFIIYIEFIYLTLSRGVLMGVVNFGAVTRIRTWVIADTTQCTTNHCTVYTPRHIVYSLFICRFYFCLQNLLMYLNSMIISSNF